MTSDNRSDGGEGQQILLAGCRDQILPRQGDGFPEFDSPIVSVEREAADLLGDPYRRRRSMLTVSVQCQSQDFFISGHRADRIAGRGVCRVS